MAIVQGAILLRHLRKLVKTHQPGHESDRQLLARFLADGEEAAFAALVQRHGPMVLGVCKSVLQHQEDAEDAFQATFLVLARKAGGIRKQESVSSWLHGVAYRLALKAKSLAGKRRAKEKTVLEPACDNPVDDLSVREWQAILHEELHRLPEKYRAVLLLCYWEGKTRDEAAEQLGFAKGTLKEQLERARNLLRSRLTRRGLIPSAALFTALFTQNAAQAISPALAEATAKAALAFASNSAATASASAVALAHGVLHASNMVKTLAASIVILFVTACGFGAWYVSDALGGNDPVNVAQPAAEASQSKDAGKDPKPAERPRVEWNGHKKDLPRSDLKIDLAPGTKVQRMPRRLLLPVKITNQSQETIITRLEHEWHGGEWPPTDLYASAIKQRLVPPPEEHVFRPLYQFGERAGQVTKPVMLKPGQSIDINVRMDWPGTGSVIGVPLMESAGQGKYEVRLLLVFEVGKAQQYVVGATTVVELPPPPQKVSPAEVKDADAGLWLNANLDRFEFALGNNGVVPSPNTLFFATKEKKLPAGSSAKVFVITKDEAASIVQTLVDSGLWGRPQEFPHLGPFGRFMTLTPANWTWSLGRADEDVSSRFIVQHLLKVSTGKREQAIKDWLAQGIKKQPPKQDPREASAARYVRRLGSGSTGPALGEPAVFMSAEAFAKALPEMALPFKTPDVDYAKERLVAISWWGGADSSMWFELMPKEAGKVIVFHRERAVAKNKELKSFVFAVANEAVFRVEGDPEPPAADSPARPINFAGLDIEIPDKGFGPPTIIADQQQLATAIPKSAEQIAKRIDFGKESLYLFRWTGSGADALSFKVNSGVKGDKEQRIVAFQYQPGGAKTDASHSYLFAIAKSAVVSVDGIPAPAAGRDPLVNAIDLTGLQAPMPAKDFGRPVEIRDAKALASAIPQKELQDRIQKQVDFTKETLHFFAWSGSGGDRLTWGIAYRFEGSELQPVVVYHYQGGVQANDQAHFKLFAVSNKARWRIARPYAETDKPYVRKIDFVPSVFVRVNEFGKPTIIASAVELAKAFPGGEDAVIKRQVDFDKEQLLYFAWMSRAGDSFAHEVDFKSRGEGIEHPIILFRFQPGKAALAVGHHHLYAIGRDAAWVVAEAGPEQLPAVREIRVPNFKPTEPQDIKKPIKVNNVNHLMEMLHGLFADKAWAGKIAPQVDFRKEHLLFFSWGGASDDKLTFKTVLTKDGPAVVFRYVPGDSAENAAHVRVFVLPNDATWRLAVGDTPD